MEKPPFQFGLKLVFVATAGIAAVLAPVIYLSPFDFLIAVVAAVAFLTFGVFFLIPCMLVYHCIRLIERRQPPDA